jgi:hypothetical protein
VAGPDVEHAGWATEGPGSRLRRRRNPLLGVLAAVLLIGGSGAAVTGIIGLVTETVPSDDEIQARGVVAALDGPDARTARFSAPGEGSSTVYVDLDDVLSNNRDQVVAATACEVTQGDRTVASFRGNRQGTSLVLEDLATVGVFRRSGGSTVVACRQLPFGRVGRHFRLREVRDFLVVRGRPSERTRPFLLVIGGVALALLAVPVGLRWRAGRLHRIP